jgi:ribonuclease D
VETDQELPTRLPASVAELVVREDELLSLARDAAGVRRLAIDVEASGMHSYRARACTVQLSWNDGRRVVVVDALALSLAPLGALLGASGPCKIVHDVAFDARLLAESGIALGAVHDTAIAARMLGRPATGLASLLESELGVFISKTMQHHDWRVRPLDDAMLGYLALDVGYLESLEHKLWIEVADKGIEEAILEETRYRIDCAIANAAVPLPDAQSAYLRVRGAERLSERELSALRAVAEVREREAEARDVPPHRVASGEALVALARSRPTTGGDVARIRGVLLSSPFAALFAENVARALASAGDRLPEDERAHFDRPALPSSVIKARRERETRLVTWRREQAQLREVDEQVILPGHCLKYAAAADVTTLEELGQIPGIGAFRVQRDGQAIVSALRAVGGDAVGDGTDV